MANVETIPGNVLNDPAQQPTKPRILLAASGSVAAIKFESLCRSFLEWAEVRAVATKSSLHFVDKASLPKDVVLYTDDEEWSSWKKIGDGVLHIELRKWADIMVIAPLSANTLAKVNIDLGLIISSVYFTIYTVCDLLERQFSSLCFHCNIFCLFSRLQVDCATTC